MCVKYIIFFYLPAKCNIIDKIAISIDDITFGRQVKEDDILYTHVNDESERLLRQKFSDLLNNEEKELLDVISEIKQKRQQSM